MIVLDKAELFDEIRKLRALLQEALPHVDAAGARADQLAEKIRNALEVPWP